jgi:hypothetical protein
MLSREESRPKVGASSNEKAAVLTNSNFSRKDFRMMLFALNITYPNTQGLMSGNPMRFMFQNGMNPATHNTQRVFLCRTGVLR